MTFYEGNRMHRIVKPLLNALIFCWVAICVFTTPALADMPNVVEFYNANLDHYFLTADANEAAAIDNGSAGPGWSRTGNCVFRRT